MVKVVEKNKLGLHFHSGIAIVEIAKPNHNLVFKKVDENIKGTIAIIEF